MLGQEINSQLKSTKLPQDKPEMEFLTSFQEVRNPIFHPVNPKALPKSYLQSRTMKV